MSEYTFRRCSSAIFIFVCFYSGVSEKKRICPQFCCQSVSLSREADRKPPKLFPFSDNRGKQKKTHVDTPQRGNILSYKAFTLLSNETTGGEEFALWYLYLSSNGATLKEKNLLPEGNTFFPVRLARRRIEANTLRSE